MHDSRNQIQAAEREIDYRCRDSDTRNPSPDDILHSTWSSLIDSSFLKT